MPGKHLAVEPLLGMAVESRLADSTRSAKGYPSFMRNEAWTDKSLNTSLGSWAELRHDTILYAKQSGIECGGDGDEPPPAQGLRRAECRVLQQASLAHEGIEGRAEVTRV